MTVLDDTAPQIAAPPASTTKDSAMTSTLTRTSEIADPAKRTTFQSDTTTRVTFTRLISAEWFKFRTVRTNVIALGGAAAAAVGFGALFSSLAGTDRGPDNLIQNPLSLSLGGFNLSQIIIAILGVALVAGEYQTGLIRTWFGAAPRRLSVLAAKTTVYGALVFIVALTAAVVAFTVGQALLPADFVALTLGSEGVAQALLGTAFYAATIGMIGVGLGFLLRSTAAGAGAVITMLMIAPLMVRLLPASIGDPIGKVLPSNAATAVQGVGSTSELLSTGWGVAVLVTWVIAIVGAAAISLTRRDA